MVSVMVRVFGTAVMVLSLVFGTPALAYDCHPYTWHFTGWEMGEGCYVLCGLDWIWCPDAPYEKTFYEFQCVFFTVPGCPVECVEREFRDYECVFCDCSPPCPVMTTQYYCYDVGEKHKCLICPAQ